MHIHRFCFRPLISLELACTVADGLTDKKRIMANITSHLFHNMGFVYETKEGAPAYWDNEVECFNLMNYLWKTLPFVNCYDQAYGVATFGNLLGAYSVCYVGEAISHFLIF